MQKLIRKTLKKMKKINAVGAMLFFVFYPLYPVLSVPVAHATDTPGIEAVSAEAPVAEMPVESPAATEVPVVVATPESTVSPEATPAPSVVPEVAVEPSPSAVASPEADPTSEVIVSPEVTPVVTTEPQNTNDGIWQIMPNGKAQTRQVVSVNETYVAPQNEKVKVKFTVLPDSPGVLTIQEIKLSTEEQATLGAVSDTAYDISSNMVDGTFRYDLSLPVPADLKNAQIKFAEDVAGLNQAQVVPNSTVDTTNDFVSAKLNHFTVFITAYPPSASSTGSGGSGWVTPEKGYVSDNLYATTDSPSKSVEYSNFNIPTIPSGATVNGIEVVVEAKTGGRNVDIKLSVDGSTYTSTTKTTDFSSGTTDSQRIFGGVTDKWGLSGLTGSSFTNANFKIKLTSNNAGGGGLFSLDQIQVNIHSTVSDSIPPVISTHPGITTEATSASGAVVNYINPTATDNVDSSVVVTCTPVSGTTFALGTTTVTCNATDAAGNNAIPVTFLVDVVDTTAPTIPTNGTHNGDILNTGVFDLTWDVSTDLVSPVTYEYQSSNSPVESGGVLTNIAYSAPLSTNSIHSSGTPEGTWYWQVRAVDATGNKSAWSPIWNITVDTTAPVITIGDYNHEPTNQNITVTATVVGGTLDVSSHEFTYGGESFEFVARDAAGNIARETVTVNNIDKTAPTVPVNGLPNGTAIATNNFDFTWDGSTDVNPVTYEFQSSLNPAQVGGVLTTGLWNSGVLPSNMIHSSGAPDGAWYWQVRATDSVGNTSAWGPIWNMTIDTTAPIITINPYVTTPTNQDIVVTASTNEGELNATSHTFTENGYFDFVATDGVGHQSTTRVTITNIDKVAPVITIGDYNTAPTNLDVTVTATTDEGTLNENSHVFTVNGSFDFVATDAAGNVTTKTVTVSNIDKEAPAKPVASVLGGDYYADQNVALSSTDNHEGVVIYYTVDGAQPTTASTLFTGLPILIDHSQTLKAIAVDAVGNISPVMTEEYGIAPTILPESIFVSTTEVSGTEQLIIWDTDDLSTSRVVYNESSVETIGSAPNYGYKYSTDTFDLAPNKVRHHVVKLTGLKPDHVYYFRVISAGSPESVSGDIAFSTGSDHNTPGSDGSVAPSAVPSVLGATTGKVLGAKIAAIITPTPTRTPTTGPGSTNLTADATPTPSASPSAVGPTASPSASPTVDQNSVSNDGRDGGNQNNGGQLNWWWYLIALIMVLVAIYIINKKMQEKK